MYAQFEVLKNAFQHFFSIYYDSKYCSVDSNSKNCAFVGQRVVTRGFLFSGKLL
jgi:hypothetical protein